MSDSKASDRIRHQHQGPTAQDRVEALCVEVELFGISDAEIDVAEAKSVSLIASDGQHHWRLVGEQHEAGGAGDLSGRQAGLSCAAGDVEDAMPGADASKLK